MSGLVDNYPSPKWQDVCPDCGWKHLNIWEHGKIHCGKCLMGGNFEADKYKNIREKYFRGASPRPKKIKE